MVDTIRSYADIIALLADNTTGDISPQDLRDMVETMRTGSGDLYISTPVTLDVVVQNTWYENSAATWTTGPDLHHWAETVNGRLYLTTPVERHVILKAVAECDLASSSGTIEMAIAVNGTPDTASITKQNIAAGSDHESVSTVAVVHMDAGDYASIMFRNTTGTQDIAIDSAHLVVLDLPS